MPEIPEQQLKPPCRSCKTCIDIGHACSFHKHSWRDFERPGETARALMASAENVGKQIRTEANDDD